jgi:hypothetical protein
VFITIFIPSIVKLVTDLQDIISETEKKKQVQDVKDLVQRLETTLENAIVEKQNEEERIVLNLQWRSLWCCKKFVSIASGK